MHLFSFGLMMIVRRYRPWPACLVTVALAYTFSHGGGAKAQANQGYVYYGA